MQKFEDMDVKDQLDTVLYWVEEIVGGIVLAACAVGLILMCAAFD